jgi:hypothetical protein
VGYDAGTMGSADCNSCGRDIPDSGEIHCRFCFNDDRETSKEIERYISEHALGMPDEEREVLERMMDHFKRREPVFTGAPSIRRGR